ncbi:MAG: 4-hydroxythreonine-4-phosphate dehydrogenase PdxA [Endomicrobia bacterium]|nr:4-hydroxythreonine-4-phosphate dehydrogenase PdxA [Endomicrobiia bacterium]
MPKPRVAITLGDIAGIGPEVVYGAVNSLKVQRVCRPVIFGDKTAIKAMQGCGDAEMRSNGKAGKNSSFASSPPRLLASFVITSDVGKVALGKPSKKSGIAAYNAVKAATQFCLDGKADALVTAPVSKESLKLAGVKYPGHTELLAALTKSKKFAMMMACGGINAVMVTRHIPLSKVSANIKTKDIVETVKLAVSFLKQQCGEWRVESEDNCDAEMQGCRDAGKQLLPSLRGSTRLRHSSVNSAAEAIQGSCRIFTPHSSLPTLPLKVVLCSLNPHAGDNGILGCEEKEIIFPAAKKLKSLGINAAVMPADSAWLKTKNGEFDLICGMYHDQIMIPLKCIDAQKIVNVTAGLPFVRTSPGHGTAFDIAGKGLAPRGLADPAAMTEAILFAAKTANSRSE